jgi:hypothetical protein
MSQSSVGQKAVYVIKQDTSVPYGYETWSAHLSEKHVVNMRSEVLTELLMEFGVLEMTPCYWEFLMMFRSNLLSTYSGRAKVKMFSKIVVTYYNKHGVISQEILIFVYETCSETNC